MDISRWIEEKQASLIDLSDQIWSYAETGYKEYQSAKALADTLKASGIFSRAWYC